MTAYRLLVQTREYYLMKEQDVAELKSAVAAAVRQGGDFVEFSAAGRGRVSTLVSPGIAVTLEEIETVELDTGSVAVVDNNRMLYDVNDINNH
ncbi:hypothetical protein [Marisediminicola sp. LYQ85]|uniref:hypothetical protein n=1 Tax=Marisediminicola sp. LYQ85 TaxID=3391062 RepID=UPI0039834E84